MPFYITDEIGTEMLRGRRFETLEAAEAAAQKSIRGIASRLAKKDPNSTMRRVCYTGLFVREAIPGRHCDRSIVWPDRIERVGA